MTTASTYQQVGPEAIPGGLCWDAQDSGQFVVVCYAGYGRAQAGDGDRYKRITDRSIGPQAHRYFKRVCCGETVCYGHMVQEGRS